MFRCITGLKGLIVDIDSFICESLEEWVSFVEEYRCVFLTAQRERADQMIERFGKGAVLRIEPFQKLFAPSIMTQRQCAKLLDLKPTEIAYVSKDIDFINNAMEFLTGTIWVTERVRYEDASRVADFVSKDLPTLYNDLKKGIKGFIGEAALFPGQDPKGRMITAAFTVDEDTYPVIFLGRYYGYAHYMSQLHPYSSAIYLNKRYGKRYFGIFNGVFSDLFLTAVRKILTTMKVDGICSVPARIGTEDRFSAIMQTVASATGIENYDGLLQCNRQYLSQKSLSQQEREENIKGVFQSSRPLRGENIILIDDIASTGSTLRECVRILKGAGAGRIVVLVLAINQIHETYWSSIPAQVSCPNCGEKMHLLVNSRNKQLFYSCYACRKQTMNFEAGRKHIIACVNREIDRPDDEIIL